MKFTETPLKGAYLIEAERMQDERGYFARKYCRDEFAAQGLHTEWPQCNISFSRARGTLRGMHFQRRPHAEVKLVTCMAGKILDVIVDVRPDSPTFLQHYKVELSAENERSLYIPEDFAHGLITLEDNTSVYYHMGSMFAPGAGATLRYNDPALAIEWPETPTVISPKDLEAADYDPAILEAM